MVDINRPTCLTWRCMSVVEVEPSRLMVNWNPWKGLTCDSGQSECWTKWVSGCIMYTNHLWNLAGARGLIFNSLELNLPIHSLELNLPIPQRTWQEDHGWSSMKLLVELGSGLMNNHSANTELVSLAHAHGNLRSEHLTTWNFGWLLEIFGCVDLALEFCTWALPESNWNIWCVLMFDWEVHLDNRQMLWFLSLSRNCLTIATGWDVLIIFFGDWHQTRSNIDETDFLDSWFESWSVQHAQGKLNFGCSTMECFQNFVTDQRLILTWDPFVLEFLLHNLGWNWNMESIIWWNLTRISEVGRCVV